MKKMTMPQGSGASMRRKLYSALSMLLVSGIMMVTSSYAWFVMSTAPEVTGIQTQVGANGALEIALLDQKSWNDLNLLDMGDIDENATTEQNAVTANLTWGNLVNLESATYGLSNIILQPSRLNIKQSGIEGTDDYTILGTLLKTPVYGEDGRVKKLEEKAVASIYKAEDKAFNETGYGVRAIGTAANMSTFQLGMNAARTQISNFTTSGRSAASTALNTHGGNMASIAVAYALQGKENGYTVQDIENIKALAVDMQAAVDQIENGMRQVYAGYITTAASGVTAADYQAALDEISTLPLAQLDTKYPNAITTDYDISTFITKLENTKKLVKDATEKCDTFISQKRTYTWIEISGIITPLVNIDKMTLGGKNVTQLKNELKDENGKINFEAALKLVQGGLNITVPSGSGLLSEIADFVGDYTATVAVKNVTVGGTHLDSVDVGMETKTTYNPPILTACSNKLAAQALTEAAGNSAITDYYGYAIDLAFRTNATNSSLQLQTDPANRIYNDGSSQNEALQGGGSYMTFKTEAGLSATKMVKLMNGVRVVFMDKSQNVLKLAKLDTTLGQGDYELFPKEERTPTNYAYLDAFPLATATTYQKSDIITEAEYNDLPATGTVKFSAAADGTNTVTAKLYLYSFSMTQADTIENGNVTGTHNTGAITIGNKISSTAITALEADTPMIVTALVYLDGSVVNNSMVAASALQSMTGTLNLQFSSSAQLMPAQNTALKDGDKNNTAGG